MLACSKPIFSFAVMSDLHFMAYQEPETPVEWVPFLEQEIDYIAALGPQFIVCNGDLTNGKARDYRLAMAAFGRCGMPVYYTMGNHEYYGYYEEPDFTVELAQRRFLEMTGMPGLYYELEVEGCAFLFLSTEYYAPDINEGGWLSDAQLEWLKERLSAAGDRPTFVFLHHPVNGTVADSVHTCLVSGQLLDILDQCRQNVMVFTGHTHCRIDREDQIVRRGGTVFFGGGCMYEEHPQSRWVDVYADRAVIRVLCHRERQWLAAYDTEVILDRRQ